MSEGLAAPAEAALDGSREDLPPVPREGVSLAALRAFADEHRGRSFAVPDEAHSGEKVSRSFEELTTAQKRTDTDGRSHVARATRFVSHAWACLFSGLLAALEAHTGALPEGQTYFWVDIFVGAQHKADELPQEWWTIAFRQAVSDIGHTVLVLQPWSAPVPLKRSWCLWEIFCSVDSGAQLDVALANEEAASFQDTLLHRFDDIALLISKIETRKASAVNKRDQAMIYGAVRSSSGGFEAVNGTIHACLRSWLVAEARKLRRRCVEQFGANGTETLDATTVLADLLILQGMFSEAEPLCREVLHGQRETLGVTHSVTLSAVNNLAVLLSEQGKLSEAEALYRQALGGYREALGDAHPDTLGALDRLAGSLSDQGKYSEAEPLCREALRGLREALGDTHQETLLSVTNLAGLLEHQGKPSESEPLLRETLRVRRATLGAAHPDTLGALHNLAMCTRTQGKLSEAEPLCRKALRGFRQALGDAHPHTLSSLHNLATCLCAEGNLAKLAEAEPLYREALRGRREALGDAHPDTVSSLNKLAILLSDQGKLSEAEALYREALGGLREALGHAHPIALTVLKNLATLLKAQGKLSEAEPLFEELEQLKLETEATRGDAQ